MKIIWFFMRLSLVFFLIFIWNNNYLGLKQEDNKQTNEVYSYTALMKDLTNQEKIEDHFNYHSINVISTQNMIALIGGGCGSGSCDDYPHTCDSGCSHLDASQCGSGPGNCVNDYTVVLCRCGSITVFTKGCI